MHAVGELRSPPATYFSNFHAPCGGLASSISAFATYLTLTRAGSCAVATYRYLGSLFRLESLGCPRGLSTGARPPSGETVAAQGELRHIHDTVRLSLHPPPPDTLWGWMNDVLVAAAPSDAPLTESSRAALPDTLNSCDACRTLLGLFRDPRGWTLAPEYDQSVSVSALVALANPPAGVDVPFLYNTHAAVRARGAL